MKIMLVGGCGYVGQRLAPYLLERGHQVAAWDAMLLNNPVPAYRLIWDDLFNITPEHLAGYDRVVFLAGLSNDPMADFSPSQNFVQNTAGPLHVAYMTKEAKVPRFIYASSASVYGNTGGRAMSVDDAVSPSYPYGISKLAGEKAVLQLADTSFEVMTIRKGTVCGWSPRMRFDLCVNAMYKDAKTKGVVTVNAGQVYRPILSMESALLEYHSAIIRPSSVPRVVNSYSQNYAMCEVGRIVAEKTHAKLVVRSQDEKRNYQLLGSKWHDGVEEIVAQLETFCGDWSPEQFEDDRWYNIRLFRRRKP